MCCTIPTWEEERGNIQKTTVEAMAIGSSRAEFMLKSSRQSCFHESLQRPVETNLHITASPAENASRVETSGPVGFRGFMFTTCRLINNPSP
ncbi:hypothetical protein E2P81_ATG06488 [Venturia nashicola]|uniref:Uncharacterized protein n=1 Tax=Venturia nashicola TaxID=86259 RepID=A0A4Z1PC45_9PEZI|nr:hypothetical protein E6O75_ATG06654 [Venturia nashicola]TLD28142.1 hypothetical protein E2P81_ATG06488 [Venturia nashicola]